MSDRLKMPPMRDFGFYQRRKHDKWREVPLPVPALEAPIADSHAHVHMLPDPAWELARCAANGVDFLCMIVDPTEDGSRPLDELASWQAQATRLLARGGDADGAPAPPEDGAACSGGEARDGDASGAPARFCVDACVAAGVHPHNAKLYDDAAERALLEQLADPRIGALGEIGLDYHYDLSPREVQRRVFGRQIALAKERGLPVALHVRAGDDPDADNAHREAFEILERSGFPDAGVLLHCCSLAPDELRPWVDAGCFIAYGGALTFKAADEARAGARIVPPDRLLVETDAPYMTPEPMRGAACTPAHVIFTAAALAEVRGVGAGEERRRFLRTLHDNTLRFYGRAGGAEDA